MLEWPGVLQVLEPSSEVPRPTVHRGLAEGVVVCSRHEASGPAHGALSGSHEAQKEVG